MASYTEGKLDVMVQLKNALKKGSSCLDVGPCDGVWSYILGDYFKMDAVEIFLPYIKQWNLIDRYDHVFNMSITDFKYMWYDVVIFGDIIEHLTVHEAQKVINYATKHSSGVLVAVPYMYEQDAINDNPDEIHKQSDLTPEIFDIRYPGFVPVWQNEFYCYYWKQGINKADLFDK